MESNTSTKCKQRLDSIFGFFILLGLVIIGFIVIKFIGMKLLLGLAILKGVVSHLDAVIIVALITGTVSIIGVLINSIIGKIIDYNKSRKEYLAQKRESSYEQFIEMFYKVIDSGKDKKEYSQEDLIKEMKGFSQTLTLWGSKKVVRKWLAFRKSVESLENPTDRISALEDIMNEMRKDMSVGKLKKWELARIFINNIDEKGNVINN